MTTINMLIMITVAIFVSGVLYKYIVSRQRLPYDRKINIELMFKGSIINIVFAIGYIFTQSLLMVYFQGIYREEYFFVLLIPYVFILMSFFNGLIQRKVVKPNHYINKYDIVIYSLSIGIGIGISNLILLGLFNDTVSSILVISSSILIPLTYMMVMAYYIIRQIEGKRLSRLLSIVLPCIIVYQEEAFDFIDSILGILGYVGFELIMYGLFMILFTRTVRKNSKFPFVDAEKQMYRFTNEKTLQERLSYRFDKFMSYGNFAITGLLVLAGVVVVLVVSVILYLETPEIADGSFLKILWLSFMRVLDPGNVATDPDFNNVKFVTITTIATFIGLAIIATYIGLVSGEFGSKIEKLREGNSKILEKDHILFLGFCEDTLKIIDNLVKLHIGKEKLNIVVVSRKPRTHLEEAIQSYGLQNLRNKITCRSGDLYSLNTLQNVGVRSASQVIIIGDVKEESFRIAMLVNKIVKESNYHRMQVTLMSDTGYDLSLAKETFGNKMTIYSREELEFEPILKALSLKEYMKLYGNLMGADGNLLIHLDFIKKTVGRTFGQIANGFSYSTVLGIERNQQVLLNPPKDMVIEKTDRLIFITDANTLPDFTGRNRKYQLSSKQVKGFTSEHVENILVIGNRHLDQLNALVKDKQQVSMTNILFQENKAFYKELDEVMTKSKPDIVVYLGNQNRSEDENDDICLQILAFLDSKYDRRRVNYTVGAVINSAQDVKFGYDLDYVDLVIESDKCRNVALKLLDKNNMIGKVENQLFEVGNRVGAILAHQVVDDQVQSVKEVSEQCLENNLILIGYITREGGLMDVAINPNKNDQVQFDDDDLLLVIQ